MVMYLSCRAAAAALRLVLLLLLLNNPERKQLKTVGELSDKTRALCVPQEVGTALRIASQRLAPEEFHKAYKDVNDVVDVCHKAGLSRKCVRLRPIICIKG